MHQARALKKAGGRARKGAVPDCWFEAPPAGALEAAAYDYSDHAVRSFCPRIAEQSVHQLQVFCCCQSAVSTHHTQPLRVESW